MRCPSCSHELVIKTDPKNTDYEYVEGIRKKDMAFDPEEAETARVQDSEVTEKLAGQVLACRRKVRREAISLCPRCCCSNKYELLVPLLCWSRFSVWSSGEQHASSR